MKILKTAGKGHSSTCAFLCIFAGKVFSVFFKGLRSVVTFVCILAAVVLTIGVVGIILTTLLDWLEKKVVKGGRR